MKNIFLNQQNITLLFVFCFFVLLAQSCKKDKKVPVVILKFDFKETFDDSVSASSWILYHDSFITNKSVEYGTPTLSSKALIISVISCHGVKNCISDTSSALRNFTNFEGEKSFKLTFETKTYGEAYLAQIRNGKFLKLAKQITTINGIDWNNITISDTFSLLKTDTLQIRFGNSFYSMLSGPYYAYYDNIELREQ